MSHPIHASLSNSHKHGTALRSAGFVVLWATCIPAASLLAFRLQGEIGLIVLAVLVPLVAMGFLAVQKVRSVRQNAAQAGQTWSEKAMLAELDTTLEAGRESYKTTAVFVVHLGGLGRVKEVIGANATKEARLRFWERIQSVTRGSDVFGWLPGDRLFIFMNARSDLTADDAFGIAKRVRGSLQDPLGIGETHAAISAAVGFCLVPPNSRETSRKLFDATGMALEDAILNGPSAIRHVRMENSRAPLKSEITRKHVREALSSGEIQAWFQPILSTDTGQISGVEALARWNHPKEGILMPAAFLQALSSGEDQRALLETVLNDSCRALQGWDSSNLHVPQVGVNVSEENLRDPELPDLLASYLTKHSLGSDRFRLEILESVALSEHDMVLAQNMRSLSDMGFRLALDDFGTGKAAISALQNFPIHCLKIDRSFVRRLDRDETQRKLVAGILGLAEQLGLETVGEGVETHGEHTVLAQLGCSHVQGFRIAMAMPAEDLQGWSVRHREKLKSLPNLSRRWG